MHACKKSGLNHGDFSFVFRFKGINVFGVSTIVIFYLNQNMHVVLSGIAGI